MKIIFTYCNPANRATKPSEMFLQTSILSAGSIKKFTDYKTVLYVDPKQNRWYKDNPYFDEIVKLDFFEDAFDPRYWNFPKLRTYSEQTEPFLHMDLDMCVVPGFKIPTSQIITERIRSIENESECFRHAYDQYTIPRNIVCSGMIGCNDVRALKTFKEIYEKARVECAVGVYDTVEFPDLYSIEEVALTQLIEKNKYTVEPLMLSKFLHFQGVNKDTKYLEEVKRLIKNFKL